MFEQHEKNVAIRRLARRPDDRKNASLPDPSKKQGEDCLPQIKHIVVLMMENHSYDNYFGMLQDRGDGFTLDQNGLPTETNPDSTGASVPLTRFPGVQQVKEVPSQSWAASHLSFNDGRNDGFVRGIEQTVPGHDATMAMKYWTEEDLPFYYSLAKTFPLATRWFSSCLGPTFPNRRFLISGTALGLIDDLMFSLGDYPKSGTIFDHLSAHSISWINYHYVPQTQINLKRIFRARGMSAIRIVGAMLMSVIPSLGKFVLSKVQATADIYPIGTLRSINHLRSMDQYFEDAKNGSLPAVCIVDPDFTLSSEENPQDIQVGEEFASRVINAAMEGPGWKDTLIIWTYDEHGGYYDHVAPPAAVAPDDVPGESQLTKSWLIRFLLRSTKLFRENQVIDQGPSTYENLGFRVPAVIISPYAKPDTVIDTVFDHTSILKLIERKWNLPPLTARDASATDPLSALDLDGPPAFIIPPELAPPALSTKAG